MRSFWQTSSESDRLAWPILLLLLTVLVPSVGIVWMMREAVRNERLATGQRLSEAYQAQLHSASQIVVQRWKEQLDQLSQQVGQEKPAQVFAEGVTAGVADSFLICDEQGEVIYPNSIPAISLEPEASDPRWNQAEQLEFTDQLAAAAEVYAKIAQDEVYAVYRARALQAQARCLLQLGEQVTAIEILQSLRLQDRLFDQHGRSFAAAAELRLLDILDRDSEAWQEVASQLTDRLGNYDKNSLPAPQRRFLMSALQELVAEPINWPTQAAEVLAAEVVAVYEPTLLIPRLHPTPLPKVWSCATEDGRVVGLYQESSLRQKILALTEGLALPQNINFVVTGPQEPSEALMDTSLGSSLAGWRLGLMTDGDPFDETSQERRAVHTWIALLVVAVTCVLGWLLATALRRRLRLARLKNDLVATVSHELKTPLASIRLLVDTLLEAEEGEVPENSRINVREYLELISHENARLTRLIDNFLTFSRLERGKQRYDFQVIDARDVVHQASTIFRERWVEDADCLQVEATGQALVLGDMDSLVTAVVNLLENARKYSGEKKEITLKSATLGDQVTIAVQDNGIGLSSGAARHVFDRFYQVDQLVARSEGGCGLGLSIVAAIMSSHGGKARVESLSNAGSTFTLYLPKYIKSAENESATMHGVPVSVEGE